MHDYNDYEGVLHVGELVGVSFDMFYISIARMHNLLQTNFNYNKKFSKYYKN